MNYLTLITRLTLILNSSKLRGDKAAYLACRSLCEQLESRNKGIWQDTGYSRPVLDDF